MLRRDRPMSNLLDAMQATGHYKHSEQITALTYALLDQSRRVAAGGSKQQQDAARLNTEVGFLSLLVAGMIRTLSDKGLVTTAEVMERIDAVDASDGVKDGKVSVDALRAILGIRKPDPPVVVVPRPALKRNR